MCAEKETENNKKKTMLQTQIYATNKDVMLGRRCILALCLSFSASSFSLYA